MRHLLRRPIAAALTTLLLGACADVEPLHYAVIGESYTAPCFTDQACGAGRFCVERGCVAIGTVPDGDLCVRGPQCLAGHACVSRAPETSGTCESITQHCGTTPAPEEVCQQLVGCAERVCDAYTPEPKPVRVICETPTDDPARVNATFQCGQGL